MYCPTDFRVYETDEDLHLLNTMHDYYHRAYYRLRQVCADLFLMEFTRMLIESYKNDNEDAYRICQLLEIGELELSAIVNDVEWFKEALNEKKLLAAFME